MGAGNSPSISAQIDGFIKKNATEIEEIQSEIDILKKIISAMPGSVYWKSRDGRFLGCNVNMANIFGRTSPDEIIGKRNDELFDPAIAAEIDRIDQEIYTTGLSKTIEEHGVNRDQPAIYISKKTPLFDNKGNVVGLLGVSFDITERKQIEEALKIAKEKAEEANRSKAEFITNLSHDVKTPLAGIIGVSELLTYRLAAEELDFAKILLISSRQLLTFFDNCLEAFKLENNNETLVIEDFNLKTTIAEICDIFNPTITSRKLYLHVDYPSTSPEIITGSRTGIYRVILNLVSNAVKFTPHGGVTIRVGLSEGKLQIIVEDTGIGIPADKQHAIFERFTRLTPSYKGTYDGNGIGLYIVHKFVSSMSGTIHVISEPEKGSQFIISLPLQQLSGNEATPSSQGQPVQNRAQTTTEHPFHIVSNQAAIIAQQTPLRVLLVEDNQVVQRIQTSLLTSFGCIVDIAETGEQALDAFHPGKYDLIFMDIGLPDMQGDLASKLIRKLEVGSSIQVPIIALTAHVSESAANNHVACGINDTMQKPLSREQAKLILEKYVIKPQQKNAQKKSQHLDSVKRMLII
jgi:two-component system, OmpR family, aerobic respiration control sensor histidine kinase ArcB